jgi:hypothetical protein
MPNVLANSQDHGADYGPGLWRRLYDDGTSVVTNIRLAGEGRKPGSALINSAAVLLALLGVGLFIVSLKAQYTYIFAEKHTGAVSLVEATALDLGLAIFSMLALGLARAGKSARVERGLVLLCAAGSALMNYAAANVSSPRSVLAYVMPPIFLAIVVDRVVAVIRRHVLGASERSPWLTFGKAALYGLRFVIAPRSTAKGARQALLNATPLPAAPEALKAVPEPVMPSIQLHPILPLPTGQTVPWPRQAPKRSSPRKAVTSKVTEPSKTKQFLAACEEKHGALAQIDLASVYRIANAIAPECGLHPGSARTALRKSILAKQVTR